MRCFVMVLGVVVMAGGCATGAANGGAVSLRYQGMTRKMYIDGDGTVMGSRYQLRPTSDGYTGIGGRGVVDLRSDGARITGLGGDDKLVALHVAADGAVVRFNGLFGGRFASLTAAPDAITGWVGGCHYDFKSVGQRYEGTRACPMGEGPPLWAQIELPSRFGALPADRKAMLMALLLAPEPSAFAPLVAR